MALIAQEQVGERIFYIGLNTALQRTRTILLAVALLYQPIQRLCSDIQLNTLLTEPLREPAHLQSDNGMESLRWERREMYDTVDAVYKLRWELLTQGLEEGLTR